LIRDAELNLLVRLCASAIRGQQNRSVEGDWDWPRLVRLARRHRVQGLAWLGLTDGADSGDCAAAELFEEAKSIAQQNLMAAAAADRLLAEFKRQGLALTFLKGLTLGALAYPNAMLKMSTDIDVLVDPAEIDEAEQCLRRLGYEREGKDRTESRRTASAKEWTWVRADGIVVDLHVRLADNPTLLPSIGARSSAQEVQVSPGIVLPTLKREELFAYLCVHGASSAWFRLKWLADLAAFLNRYSAAEIRDLYFAARSVGAGRCPDVSLLLLEELFGPLIPPDVAASAARDPIARLLAMLSLRELAEAREPLERPLGTVFIHLGQLFIDRGFRFPLREFRRQFSNLIA